MTSSNSPDTSAGAAADREVDLASKDKVNTPCYPYVLLFVPVRDPDQDPLDLNQEYDRIYAIMSTTDVRNLSMTFKSTWRDVVKEVQSRHPLILHFACHSEDKGIKLFRRDVDADTILKALRSHNEEAKKSGKEQVQLVVFNACSSNGHAEKLKDVVDFAIGHKGGLDDDDAVDFAHSFYDCLFKGQSLWNSMEQAEGCSRFKGYELHTKRDAKAFRLHMPEKRATETEEDETAMIRYFKENGLKKIARALCEELEIEDWKFEDLKHLTDESLDELTETKLKPHQRNLFWELVAKKVEECTVSTAHLSSPGGDEADLSETDTVAQSDQSDASDSEDASGQKEVVMARNAGDKASFETHLRRFLRQFGRFTGNHQIGIDVSKEVMQTERDGEERREWTMCMLVWLRVAKDVRMHEESREQWEQGLAAPSQDKMLRTLDEILRRGDVTYKYWHSAELAAKSCKKKFASVVLLTHVFVRACLPSGNFSRQAWDKRVMRDWSANTEDARQVLQRMNRYLWSQVEAIQVITNVIETQSYVCYMSMHKIACLMLFEYLETYKKEKMATMPKQSGIDSSMWRVLEGFSMFASSSCQVFALQKISARNLRTIRRRLRVLARLPGRLWLLLGPSRRAEGLLGEEGRSVLTDHQKHKAKECEEAMARRRGVHLRGPAGTGKTFMALHMMLRELEKDRSCSVLFLLRSEGFVYFIAQWVLSMARWKLVDEGLFDRIFFSFRGARGWDGPFWMMEGGGELRRQEKKVELLLEDASEYKYVVIDEAHHVFSDREATEYITTKSYDKATMLLMSDSSQADVTSVAYPRDLDDVYLTEVVRNSQRTMTASLVFQRGVATAEVCCYHKIAGRPVRPYVFSSNVRVKRLGPAREYIPHVVRAMKEAMAEFPENLNRKIAILVHEELVREGLKQVLQGRLNRDRHFQSRFQLIDAADAWKTTRAGDDWSERESIIFDTVGNFDGMESKIVIAVGLDEESSGNGDLQRSLLYRAITRCVKEGMAMLVNRRVERGVLSFLDGLKYEETFDAESEKKKIDQTPWEDAEAEEGKERLQAERGAAGKEEDKTKGKGTREGEEDRKDAMKLSSFSRREPEPSRETSSSSPSSSLLQHPAMLLSEPRDVQPAGRRESQPQAKQKTDSKRIDLPTRYSQIAQSVWDTRKHEKGKADPFFQPYGQTTWAYGHALIGHTGYVNGVVYSPDGRQLASGSEDETVRVWDAESGACLRTLEGHTGYISSVVYSPDGRQLASGSEDETVRVWDAESGACLRTLEGHTGCISSVVYSPDGRQLASGSEDETVRVWDAESGACLRTLKGHTDYIRSVVYSADGRQLASGSEDETVRVWDAESGACLRTLEGHTSWVRSVVYSPDGRQLASGSWDGTVRVWDAESGACLRTLKGHTNSVISVVYSPDGRQLASGSEDKSIRVWDAESGACLRTLEGHTDSVNSVVYSPDGRQLASGSEDETVRVWEAWTANLSNLLLKRRFEGSQDQPRSLKMKRD